MKKIFFFALAAAFLSACSGDKYYTYENVEFYVMDFESAQLGDDGFLWGKSQATEQDDVDYMGNPILSNIYYGPLYTQKNASVFTYFTDYGHTTDSWNGFVVSNHTDMTTSGYTNDKSVYAKTGANESAKFAVGYCSTWTPEGKGIPTIEFSSSAFPATVAIANTTYTYLYLKDATPVDYSVEITGYNCGVETGKVTVELASASAKTIESGWKTIKLTDLGEVTKLTFVVVCSDAMAPTYLAVDDLTYTKDELMYGL